MERKVLVTMKDIQKYKVLTDVIEKKIKGNLAAKILGISYVHVSRLKKKFITYGFEGILRKPPPSPPNKKISQSTINNILKLRKSLYYDFNITHFKEKLQENHNIKLSYESLRQILISNGLHQPTAKKKVHRMRRRMPKAGMLVQMDSSFHNWLPHIKDKWWLIAMIDDATNEVPFAYFFPKDTLFANMFVIRKFIELKGIFMSLYVDKASHFITTRHGGLHYSVNIEQNDSQIQRALKELDITLIPANSPQAKGRIEVTFRLFQDRLIKEMRLAAIKDYDHANIFLNNVFLPSYNAKFSHPTSESVYAPLPNDTNLDLIFCIKQNRTVNNDNTFKFYNHTFQIPPSNFKTSFARSIITVCLLPDNRIFALYNNKVIFQSFLPSDSITKRIDNLLNQRDYMTEVSSSKPVLHIKKVYRPPKSHPWKKSFKLINSNVNKKKELSKIEKEAIKEIEKLFGGIIHYVE